MTKTIIHRLQYAAHYRIEAANTYVARSFLHELYDEDDENDEYFYRLRAVAL